MFEVNRNPDRKEIRKFGWAMLGGFAFLAVLAWLAAWRSDESGSLTQRTGTGWHIVAVILIGLAGTLFATARFAPNAAKPIYVTWMTVGTAIGRIISTLLLTVLFVIVLPIFSLIVRSSDPMRRRWGQGDSYWEPHKQSEATLDRMRHLF